MRRAGLAALACGVILAATAAIAWAVPQPIVGKADNTFAAPSYDLAGGTVASLTTEGASTHNVTASAVGADGLPLFKSANVAGGPTPVNGTQFLPAGDYAFTCTLHAGMASSLKVTGTPLPRPTVEITILSKKLDKVVSSGKLKVKTATSATAVDLVAKLGAKTIGSAKPAGSATTTMKLTKSGKSALAKKSSAKVAVTGTVEFGEPATVKRTLK
jgi:plastocyanin